MRVLLTGAGGQLGQRFVELAPFDVVSTQRPGGHAPARSLPLDVTDQTACVALAEDTRPDWIVHSAAMTNVDACERDPPAAWNANAEATQNMAIAAEKAGARFLYVSTDYVYDGQRGNYKEDDPTNPTSEYGRTKLAGEKLASSAPHLVVARTSVVFGPHKNNFVTWLIGELRAGRPVRIVRDQWVSPTLTTDLTEQLLALIRADARGIYHTAGASALSRLEMAYAIADEFELDRSLITPILSSDLSWLAPRPPNSTLDVSKIAALKRPLTFTDALRRLKAELATRRSTTPKGTSS